MTPRDTSRRSELRSSAVLRAVGALVTAAVALGALTGCSLFGRNDKTTVVSALKAKPGDCLVAPTAITAEVTNVTVVPCTQPHQQEVYALAAYPLPAGTEKKAAYPGEAVLKAFADGACLGAFAGYVGSDYRDSSLFFTYLLPSARGWQAGDDRDVTCVITTTGSTRTSSVKGSKL
ncbi:MAG TPA: septum formation family protein [Cellulomonadaceae bacterium]|nr:septum formation family protein [Cellulomonadaceae bacterium]